MVQGSERREEMACEFCVRRSGIGAFYTAGVKLIGTDTLAISYVCKTRSLKVEIEGSRRYQVVQVETDGDVLLLPDISTWWHWLRG